LFMTQWVTRGAKRPLVVADMPFGSYEASNEQAVGNAVRLVKEGGADAVKLERGGTSIERAKAIVDAGIPVMGHVGLTPQTATVLGGFKAQGRTADRAQQLIADALALQGGGCFAIVLEAVPSPVAKAATEALAVPTIGMGAGGARPAPAVDRANADQQQDEAPRCEAEEDAAEDRVAAPVVVAAGPEEVAPVDRDPHRPEGDEGERERRRRELEHVPRTAVA